VPVHVQRGTDLSWTFRPWEEALPPGGTSAPQICNLDCQYPNLISNHPIREPSNPPSGETVPVIAELVLNQNQPSLSLRSSYMNGSFNNAYETSMNGSYNIRT
jgi:hypothetical protein